MLQPPSSPSRPEFTPRREFIREQRSPPNSFSIVAIASSSFIRLYSFPPLVAATLHNLFDDHKIYLATRQGNNFCEFTLDGKPWSNAKSVATEKLLIDIFSALYQLGYTYLSSLDYGRDVDDLLLMAFSVSSSSSAASREGTPVPSSHLPDSSSSCSPDKHRHHRVPFGLSFVSSTCMRVISPPLHLTPAILQAVRGAWSRGVVSEKKVGDNSFEFRLKGYKWFQQDTFATDSLRYILTILSTLDAQSFTLLSSISIKTRSRVKDLWIFMGPASFSTDDLVHPESPPSPSHGGSRKQAHTPESPFRPYPIVNHGFTSQHRRFATEPVVPSYASPPHPSHFVKENISNGFNSSGVMEDPSTTASSSHSFLRKPAPRAQVPVSVVNEDVEVVADGVRANLPSVISSSAENMTGVGASGFLPEKSRAYSIPAAKVSTWQAASHFITPTPSPDNSPSTSMAGTRPPVRSMSTREKATYVNGPGSSQKSSQYPPPPDYYRPSAGKISPSSAHAPSVGASGIRDSAFSSSRHASLENSVPWTGIPDATAHEGTPPRAREERNVRDGRRIRRQPRSREEDRKPIAGKAAVSPPPSPNDRRAESPMSVNKQGWVLVNVDSGRENEGWFPVESSNPQALASQVEKSAPTSIIPPTKAIAAKDAIEAGKTPQGASSAPSPMKRLFGLVRKSSQKGGSPSK